MNFSEKKEKKRFAFFPVVGTCDDGGGKGGGVVGDSLTKVRTKSKKRRIHLRGKRGIASRG